MTLSLVRAPRSTDVGDRVTSDGVWSLTHELATDDDTGDDRFIVVATHLATGLELTHDLAGVDDWLMSGVALAELKAQAVNTINGLALDDEKTAARAALVYLGELFTAASVDAVEYRCECAGFLATATGRRLVHVDVCRSDVDGRGECEPDAHRICLEPAARRCGHALCRARGCAYAPPCEAGHDDCCGPCCHGDD